MYFTVFFSLLTFFSIIFLYFFPFLFSNCFFHAFFTLFLYFIHLCSAFFIIHSFYSLFSFIRLIFLFISFLSSVRINEQPNEQMNEASILSSERHVTAGRGGGRRGQSARSGWRRRRCRPFSPAGDLTKVLCRSCGVGSFGKCTVGQISTCTPPKIALGFK